MDASPFGAILSQLFWVVFILLAVMPMIRQRMLESARLSLIRQIEKKRGSRVIVLIHRQESLALFGVPLFRFISVEDSEEVLRAIRMTPPDMPIDIILHTPGGLVLASQQIACALCDHKAKVTAFVPHYAMSGGTLIALAADEIVMDPHAVLGPVDPQVGQFPAASILKVVEQKDANEVDDQTLILADISRKAMQQALTLVKDVLMANGMDEAQAHALADQLTQGYYTHDYPISASALQAMGVKVRTDMPAEIYQLMALYPQPAQRTSGVDYVPVLVPFGDAAAAPTRARRTAQEREGELNGALHRYPLCSNADGDGHSAGGGTVGMGSAGMDCAGRLSGHLRDCACACALHEARAQRYGHAGGADPGALLAGEPAGELLFGRAD
jgi:ClpP class serine protease